MSTNKYIQILGLLVKQTDSGRLDWKETESQSGFLTSLLNYSVLISEEAGSLGYRGYVISIVDSGKIVDKFSDATLRSQGVEENYFEVMQDLFNKARRRSLKVDEALDTIIAHLGGAVDR